MGGSAHLLCVADHPPPRPIEETPEEVARANQYGVAYSYPLDQWRMTSGVFNQLKRMVKVEHNWAVIHLLSLSYVAVLFPGCFLIGREFRHVPTTFRWYVQDRSREVLAHWVNVNEAEPESSMTVAVDRATNTVRVDADGITDVAIFLNDRVVDLSRPVAFVLNGREEGPAKTYTRNIDTTFENEAVAIEFEPFVDAQHRRLAEEILQRHRSVRRRSVDARRDGRSLHHRRGRQCGARCARGLGRLADLTCDDIVDGSHAGTPLS